MGCAYTNYSHGYLRKETHTHFNNNLQTRLRPPGEEFSLINRRIAPIKAPTETFLHGNSNRRVSYNYIDVI